MDNLIFSLNATVPVFAMMLLGLLFKKIGWMDDVFASKMNKFVFLTSIPSTIIKKIGTVAFRLKTKFSILLTSPLLCTKRCHRITLCCFL